MKFGHSSCLQFGKNQFSIEVDFISSSSFENSLEKIQAHESAQDYQPLVVLKFLEPTMISNGFKKSSCHCQENGYHLYNGYNFGQCLFEWSWRIVLARHNQT